MKHCVVISKYLEAYLYTASGDQWSCNLIKLATAKHHFLDDNITRYSLYFYFPGPLITGS